MLDQNIKISKKRVSKMSFPVAAALLFSLVAISYLLISGYGDRLSDKEQESAPLPEEEMTNKKTYRDADLGFEFDHYSVWAAGKTSEVNSFPYNVFVRTTEEETLRYYDYAMLVGVYDNINNFHYFGGKDGKFKSFSDYVHAEKLNGYAESAEEVWGDVKKYEIAEPEISVGGEVGYAFRFGAMDNEYTVLVQHNGKIYAFAFPYSVVDDRNFDERGYGWPGVHEMEMLKSFRFIK